MWLNADQPLCSLLGHGTCSSTWDLEHLKHNTLNKSSWIAALNIIQVLLYFKRLPNKREFATSVEFLHWRKSSEWHSFMSLLHCSLSYERGGEGDIISNLFPFFCTESTELNGGCICRFRKSLHLFALNCLWKWKKQRPAHYLWCELEFAWENVAMFTFIIMQFLFGYAMFAPNPRIYWGFSDSPFFVLSKLISMLIIA